MEGEYIGGRRNRREGGERGRGGVVSVCVCVCVCVCVYVCVCAVLTDVVDVCTAKPHS